MSEFEYQVDGQEVTIEITDYTPFFRGSMDEPRQVECIEFDIWQGGDIIGHERSVTHKQYEAILRRFKELR